MILDVTDKHPKEHDMTLVRLVDLGENHAGDDWVVGDPHGQRDLLTAVLRKIGFDFDRDRLIATGDIVDRGDGSEALLDMLDLPWFHSVAGNHERMLMEAAAAGFRGEDARGWMAGDGRWTLGMDEDRLTSLARKACAMPLLISAGAGEGRFHVVHAEALATGFDPLDDFALARWDGRRDEELAERLTWGRSLRLMTHEEAFGYQSRERLSKVFCGHTSVGSPAAVRGRQCFLDMCSWTGLGGLVAVNTRTGMWTMGGHSGEWFTGTVDWSGESWPDVRREQQDGRSGRLW